MLGWLRKSLDLSFVVIAFNMDRELPKTLTSLTKPYQRGSEGINYEVIVIDNGSKPPFGKERVEAYGDYFRYIYLENASPSPAYALNHGVANARGKIVCLMIDGARILSPGVVNLASFPFRAFEDPTVSVSGWHLGPDLQNRSIARGYNQAKEDALLERIGFPDDGYQLFKIAVFAGSCGGGWFLPIAESNAVFIRKESYIKLGGYDERFDVPGGGFLNLDFYRRAVMRDESEVVLLLGEGAFHQIHGGAATNQSEEEQKKKMERWRAQYRELRGESYRSPVKRPIYLGTLPAVTLPSVEFSARKGIEYARDWG